MMANKQHTCGNCAKHFVECEKTITGRKAGFCTSIDAKSRFLRGGLILSDEEACGLFRKNEVRNCYFSGCKDEAVYTVNGYGDDGVDTGNMFITVCHKHCQDIIDDDDNELIDGFVVDNIEPIRWHFDGCLCSKCLGVGQR